MYRGTASFTLRSSRIIGCPPGSSGFEVDSGGVKVRVKCEDGTAVYELEAVGESQEVIKEKAELLTYAMSLIRGVGLEINSFTTTPQPMSDGKATVHAEMTVRTKYQLDITEYVNEPLIRRAMELMNKFKNALRNPNINKKAEELLRIVRWWALGDLDTDPVDKFLKFFIAFEMLASLMGYKGKSGDSWAEEFCNDYGLTCEFEGMRVNRIRNLIMHEPGKERDQAEEVARKHADEFGREVFKAIRRVIGEELGIGV